MKQVFVHGLGQTPDSWARTLSAWAPPGGCVCPDLAELTAGGEAAYGRLYGAFARYCGALDGPLDLCGLSLGAVLALHYAAEHPAQVRSLVLIAPRYRMPRGLLRLQSGVFRLLPQSAFRQTGFTKAQFLGLCRSMLDLDLGGRLSAVTCPVLVLCGERDSPNKRACTDLARRLERSSFQWVPGAGHEVNVQAPERLAGLLRAFYIGLE